jgi:hypothetical protein
MRILATPIYYAFFTLMGAGSTSVVAVWIALRYPGVFCDPATIGPDKPVPDHWLVDAAPWLGGAAGLVVAWGLPRMFRRSALDPGGKLAVRRGAVSDDASHRG